MDSGLSPQDKKDLDKFIKFFALKVRKPALLFFSAGYENVNVMARFEARAALCSFVSSTS